MAAGLVKIGEEDEAQSRSRMDKTVKSEARELKTKASVIPPPRKSVKRIMYEAVLNFFPGSLSSQGTSSDGLHDGSDIATPLLAASRAKNTRRINPTTHHD